MSGDILGKIAEWLRMGTPEAEHIVDLPWMVEENREENMLVATTAPYPFRLLIFYNEDYHLLRLVVETRIKTVFMDNDEKLRVYHYLLSEINRYPLVKAYLFGSEQEVAITVDISSLELGKEEFDDALNFLMGTVGILYDKLGRPEEAEEESLSLLFFMIKNWYEKGWTKERIKKLLMRGGLSEEEAAKIVNDVIKIAEKATKKKTQSTGTMYV